MKKLYLIDGNSFYYRAFFAIKGFSNSKGQPTNAVYGFIAMITKLIKEENPDYLAIAFDKKAPHHNQALAKPYYQELSASILWWSVQDPYLQFLI